MASQALAKHSVLRYTRQERGWRAGSNPSSILCLAKCQLSPLYTRREATAVAEGLPSRLRLKLSNGYVLSQ